MLVNFKRLKGWDFFLFLSLLLFLFCFVFFIFYFFLGGGSFKQWAYMGVGGRGLSLEKSYIMMGLGVFTDKCL